MYFMQISCRLFESVCVIGGNGHKLIKSNCLYNNGQASILAADVFVCIRLMTTKASNIPKQCSTTK